MVRLAPLFCSTCRDHVFVTTLLSAAGGKLKHDMSLAGPGYWRSTAFVQGTQLRVA